MKTGCVRVVLRVPPPPALRSGFKLRAFVKSCVFKSPRSGSVWNERFFAAHRFLRLIFVFILILSTPPFWFNFSAAAAVASFRIVVGPLAWFGLAFADAEDDEEDE